MKKYLYIALLGLLATSCTEDVMDSINKDQGNPPASSIDAKFQITDGIMSTAFTTISGTYAWYASSYTEQIFGCGANQLMKAETRDRGEIMSSSTNSNEWNGSYRNMNNYTQILEKTAEGGKNQGQYDIRGMAQTMLALTLGVMTDLNGDIPYSEAFQGKANLSPKLDKQEDIYKSVLALLDSAIVNLNVAKTAKLKNAGSQDLLFKNDNGKWIGLAHALKARYLLHTLGRNSQVLPSVLAEANTAIANGFDGAVLSVFNGTTVDNPWAAFFWSRYYSGSSKTVVDLMTERNDPREAIYNFDMFGKNVIGIPGDAVQSMTTQNINAPAWLDNGASSIHMMSKAELYFIIAEVQARQGADCKDALHSAIGASFSDYQATSPTSESEIIVISDKLADYLVGIDAKVDANPLSEVMTQKYLSQCRDEQIETFNDIRRCMFVDGKSFVELKNPNNTKSGVNCWPYRAPYGNSDVTANPNVTTAYGDGTYVFSKKTWIFGGE